MTTNEPNSQKQQPSAMGPAGTDDAAARGGPSAGVMAMHGHLQKEPKGFWADAWSRVLQRPSAVIGLIWVGIVAFFALFSPLIANGHPLVMWEVENGQRGSFTSPLLANLSSVDVLLLIGGVIIPLWLMTPTKNLIPERLLKCLILGGAMAAGVLATLSRATEIGGTELAVVTFVTLAGVAIVSWPLMPGESKRSERLLIVLQLSILAGLIAFAAEMVALRFDRPDVTDWMREIERSDWFVPVASLIVAGALTLLTLGLLVLRNLGLGLPFGKGFQQRALLMLATGVLAGTVISHWWMPPLPTFDYTERERAGEVEAVHAVIPYSPNQRQMELRLTPPGQSAPPARRDVDSPEARRPFLLGSDSSGQDLLSQLLHACRLSISIGLVATGIAVTIGVTLGALMGYFGRWVDMTLYRLVEIVMAVPLLFVLIVAAAVLPKNIYVMMAIIGCFTWTNAARYTRAEFMRLRDQDFVQSARAVGLPTRAVLFRHMLPNGVTPVLVDASFGVAVAILFEAILSFLGLGPEGQASWGRLLAQAFDDVGDFVPWLAIFPGFAIFLTVLSLVLVGEALRDAIDPKLKKAAH